MKKEYRSSFVPLAIILSLLGVGSVKSNGQQLPPPFPAVRWSTITNTSGREIPPKTEVGIYATNWTPNDTKDDINITDTSIVKTYGNNVCDYSVTARTEDPNVAGKDGAEDGEGTYLKITIPGQGSKTLYTNEELTDSIINHDLPDNGFASDSIPLFYTDSVPSGIEDVRSVSAKIYPNPARDMLTLDLGEIREEDVEYIRLFNSAGVYEYGVNELGKNSYNMDVSGLSKGIYFLSIGTKNGIVTGKVVVQ